MAADKPAILEGREDEPVSMGVDIVEIERMRAIIERSPAFPKRAFSEEEQAYCEKMSQPAVHYATRFAAKEAVLKALGCGFNGVGLRDVEVVLNAKGKPRVKLFRKAAAVAMERGIRSIPISLSYTHTDAVACALAITDEGRVPPAKEDPTAVLTRKFKEARAMLDELDTREEDIVMPGTEADAEPVPATEQMDFEDEAVVDQASEDAASQEQE